MNRPSVAALVMGVLSACATLQTSSALPVGLPLRLSTVDGQPAGERTFSLILQNDRSYAATFNCNKHFGTYSYGEALVLKAGASTALACDRLDLSTGRRTVYDPSLANEFFADPNFRVLNYGSFVEFRNSRHTFRFAARQ